MKIKNISRYYIASLILITIIVLAKGIHQGDFWYSDAARHAMDGVFLLDFFKDLPIFHISDYTIQYYTKYPALGIGRYPPLFPLVEAVFYALFGISIVSARLTVLFFALIAAIFWFRLVRAIFDERVAFYSTFLFITTPLIVKWSRSVMLEMPALAMVILSVYFFYNFIECNKSRYRYYLILATAAAAYTKQTTVFLVPLFFFYIILTKKYKRLLSKDVIFVIPALLILVLPLAIITLKYGKSDLAQSVGNVNYQSHPIFLNNWLYYPRALFNVIPKPVLILSIASILLLFIKGRNELQKSKLFFAWILGFYLVFSYLWAKETRYIYFWLPPFTLLPALLINEVRLRIKGVPAATILLIPLCIYQFFLSFNLNKPLVYGYEEAARYIFEKQEGTVMFQGSGVGTGNFIFHIRKLDIDRKMVVFRGDKIFASSSIFPHWSLVEHVKNIDEIYALLETYGCRYFIIEERAHHNINAYKLLREALKSKDFTMVKRIGIGPEINNPRGESLLIYKLNKEPSLKRDMIRMRLPVLGVKISVTLKTLSDFYTPSDSTITALK